MSYRVTVKNAKLTKSLKVLYRIFNNQDVRCICNTNDWVTFADNLSLNDAIFISTRLGYSKITPYVNIIGNDFLYHDIFIEDIPLEHIIIMQDLHRKAGGNGDISGLLDKVKMNRCVGRNLKVKFASDLSSLEMIAFISNRLGYCGIYSVTVETKPIIDCVVMDNDMWSVMMKKPQSTEKVIESCTTIVNMLKGKTVDETLDVIKTMEDDNKWNWLGYIGFSESINLVAGLLGIGVEARTEKIILDSSSASSLC
jgi:hypothetical protein